MKALLIDDEAHCRKNLALLLQRYCPEITETSSADSVDTALEQIELFEPDILFLDVQMPQKDGFHLLKMTDLSRFQIIFVTAHEQYAIRSIECGPSAYLLKPIDIDELKRAVQKTVQQIALKLQNQSTYNSALQHLASSLELKKAPDRICLSDANKLRIIALDDILYLSSDNYYTQFHLKDGTSIVMSKTLKHYENPLAKPFIRVHRSYLVHTKYITEYNYGNNTIKMSDQTVVPVSRRKAAEVIQTIKQLQ